MANTLEPTKQERRILIEIIRKGNLVRYREWLKEMDALIHKPYSGNENAFDRCMEVTKQSRNFYKEAMQREDFYRNTQLLSGAGYLLFEKYIDENDLAPLRDEIKHVIIQRFEGYKDNMSRRGNK